MGSRAAAVMLLIAVGAGSLNASIIESQASRSIPPLLSVAIWQPGASCSSIPFTLTYWPGVPVKTTGNTTISVSLYAVGFADPLWVRELVVSPSAHVVSYMAVFRNPLHNQTVTFALEADRSNTLHLPDNATSVDKLVLYCA